MQGRGMRRFSSPPDPSETSPYRLVGQDELSSPWQKRMMLSTNLFSWEFGDGERGYVF